MTLYRAVPLVLLLSAPAVAGDWPGWLGPKRDGSSAEKVKPWKGELKPLWRKAVGRGHGSAVVAGGVVYLHTQVKDKEAEQLTAFDAKKGDVLWSKSYDRPKFTSQFGTGPRATPAVAGGRVFTYGATSILTCFDAKSGKQLWQVDGEKKYKAPRLFFGASCSPLVEVDNVVINVGGKEAGVVAFKAKDGEVAWKALDEKASYSSGIAVGAKGDRQLVFFTQKGLRGLAPKDGKLLWDFPLVDKLNESSTTPVAAGDVLLASSITSGMVGLKVKKGEGKWSATQAWKEPKLTCYFSTPTMIDKKHALVVTGQVLFPQATLHCVETATGKVKWSRKNVGKYHAAMLRTGDGKLLMLTDYGDLLLLAPNAEKYEELARAKVSNAKGGLWAHPALAGGRVYIRDEKELICLKVGEEP